MDKNFGGVIWTNHALKRLSDRGIKQGDAWVTWKRPEQSRYAKSKGAWIYYRRFGDQKVEVAAKKNEKGEWIILSVWSRKVLEKRKVKKKSFLSLLLSKVLGKNDNSGKKEVKIK